MEKIEESFFEKFEKFKNHFDNSLKLIENKLAENLSNESKYKKLSSDFDDIKVHIENTEKSLQELKSILKWNYR